MFVNRWMNKQIETDSYKRNITQKQKETNYWYKQQRRWAQKYSWVKEARNKSTNYRIPLYEVWEQAQFI